METFFEPESGQSLIGGKVDVRDFFVHKGRYQREQGGCDFVSHGRVLAESRVQLRVPNQSDTFIGAVLRTGYRIRVSSNELCVCHGVKVLGRHPIRRGFVHTSLFQGAYAKVPKDLVVCGEFDDGRMLCLQVMRGVFNDDVCAEV